MLELLTTTKSQLFSKLKSRKICFIEQFEYKFCDVNCQNKDLINQIMSRLKLVDTVCNIPLLLMLPIRFQSKYLYFKK